MKRREDAFAAAAVAIFPLLTAWGNAMAMLIISAIGSVVGVVGFRRHPFRGHLLAVAVAAAIVAATSAIAVEAVLRQNH